MFIVTIYSNENSQKYIFKAHPTKLGQNGYKMICDAKYIRDFKSWSNPIIKLKIL